MLVGTEGQLIQETSVDLIADVEAGIAFFGGDVLPVLSDDGRSSADRRGVVNRMGVSVGHLERDAILQALVGADDQGVEIRVGDRLFEVEIYVAERGG